jgi:hypothetical protein
VPAVPTVEPVARRPAIPDLTGHRDPILREIGVQLRDGRIQPRDVLSAGAYRAVVLRALERLRLDSCTAAPRGARR